MYELFRYVVFPKSLFFSKNMHIFHRFPEKTPVFHHMYPKFSVIFRKTPSFFTQTPKNPIFRFSQKSRI